MKKRYFLVAILFGIIASFSLVFNTQPRPEETLEQKPSDWFYLQRAYPQKTINQEAYKEASQQAWAMRQQNFSNREDGVWEFAGPTNIGGRISCVLMHPNDMETLYVGAASGGVFKSTDLGDSWEPIFDDALSLSIGDIEIAPSNDQVLYVGTGEANGGGGSISYEGMGMYKTTNGGQLWEHIGLENAGSIGRVVIHPDDPNMVYVAVMGRMWSAGSDRGVYRTINGGQDWEQILYVSDSTGAIDIVIDPQNPEILYASMWERMRYPDKRHYGGITSGLYKTIDGGDNWTELSNGLPSSPSEKGRIGIDLCASEPNVLYAIYANKTGYFEGIYRSEDGGNSWEQTNDNSLNNAYSSFGWWFGRIKVDPTDADRAYVIGLNIYRTTNGGGYWIDASANMHVDQHDVYIHPEDTDIIIVGNDGGLYISENGGFSYDHNEQLPITQFYTCEIDESEPLRLYGGTQDNGTNRTMTGDWDDWDHIYGGDGFRVLVDPNNNNYVYASSQYGGFGRSINGGYGFNYGLDGISGARFNWSTPYIFNPLNSNTLYIGGNKVYKTTNRAQYWQRISDDLTDGAGEYNQTFGTITTIAVSVVDTNIIYVGTDDGNVWYSPDDGGQWINIKNGLPNRWITCVAADPFEENTAYVTVSGYRYDSFLPHVFKTTDNGFTWVDISSNLPEAPVNKILPDPEVENLLYLANDFGIYYSTDAGISWNVLGNGLPNVPVVDMDFYPEDRFLIAATYGRSMYKLEVDNAVSISEHQETAMRVYPNPFTSSVTFDIETGKNSSIRILDISGRLIRYFDTIEGHIIHWDGRNQSGDMVRSGHYFAQLIFENEVVGVEKVIKAN